MRKRKPERERERERDREQRKESCFRMKGLEQLVQRTREGAYRKSKSLLMQNCFRQLNSGLTFDLGAVTAVSSQIAPAQQSSRQTEPAAGSERASMLLN